MSANFVDGLLGYEYCIEKRGSASHDEVNDFLINNNCNAISERTYRHYRSLLKYGFRSYFPINQFDVSRMLRRLPVAPDRRRYDREKVEIETEISPDGIVWFPTIIINKSMVGFGMTSAKELPIKNSDPIWLRIERYHNIPAILVWHELENNIVKFGVRAVEFVSSYKIFEETIYSDEALGLLIVKKTSEEDITWKELYDLMGKVEKLLDASSELLKHVSEIIKRKVSFSPSVISSIKFSSPGELNVIIDWKVFALLLALIKVIQHWRIEKDRFKEQNRTVKLDNDMREIQIKFARKTIKSKKSAKLEITKQLLEALPGWVKRVLDIDALPSTLFKPGSLENQMFTEQLLPVAADLVAGDDPEINVDVKETSSNEPDKN